MRESLGTEFVGSNLDEEENLGTLLFSIGTPVFLTTVLTLTLSCEMTVTS